MADIFDRNIASLTECLASAKAQVAGGNIFAQHDVETIERELVSLAKEAAEYRAKTPEQLAAEQAARDARWEAREARWFASELPSACDMCGDDLDEDGQCPSCDAD